MSTLSLQEFISYSSGFPTPVLVPMEGSASVKLCFSKSAWLSLQFWRTVVCPVTSLLWQIKKSFWFFSFFSFLLIVDRVIISKLFTWQTGNWKFYLNFLKCILTFESNCSLTNMKNMSVCFSLSSSLQYTWHKYLKKQSCI